MCDEPLYTREVDDLQEAGLRSTMLDGYNTWDCTDRARDLRGGAEAARQFHFDFPNAAINWQNDENFAIATVFQRG